MHNMWITYLLAVFCSCFRLEAIIGSVSSPFKAPGLVTVGPSSYLSRVVYLLSSLPKPVTKRILGTNH